MESALTRDPFIRVTCTANIKLKQTSLALYLVTVQNEGSYNASLRETGRTTLLFNVILLQQKILKKYENLI